MFKFIYELATDPLGLPVEWYYEWIVLGTIAFIAYKKAYSDVGVLYRGDFISGSIIGSLCHWMIRIIYFVSMWTIIYGVILIGKFVLSHKFESCITVFSVIMLITAVKYIIWINERKELVKVKIRNNGYDFRN